MKKRTLYSSLVIFIILLFDLLFPSLHFFFFSHFGQLSSIMQPGAYLILAGFFLRILLMNLIVSLFLGSVWSYGSFKKPSLFLIFFILQAVLLTILADPGTFEKIPGYNNLIASLTDFYSLLRWIPVFNLVCFSVWISLSELKPQEYSKFRRKVPSLAVLFFVFLFVSTDPYFSFTNRPEGGHPPVNKNHILIFIIDSLDPSADLSPAANETLKSYLHESQKSKFLVTAIPQTHGSISSIMSGLSPEESGIRMPFQSRVLMSPESTGLNQLKKEGYRIEYWTDGAEFSSQLKEIHFDNLVVPNYGVLNFIPPLAYRGIFFNSYFNNEFGWLFLPEIKSNHSFPGYRPESFRQDVLENLNRLSNEERPTAVIIHFCLLHWPFANRFPYWLPGGDPANPLLSPFGAGQKMARLQELVQTKDRYAREKFYRELYHRSTEYVTEVFLNPIFSSLKKDGYLDNSTVALISDHGEDIPFAKESFRQDFTIQHGSSLIFSNRSEFPTFYLLSPKKTNIPNDYWNLKDLVPLLSGKTIPNGLAFSETGLWPMRQSEDLLSFVSWGNLLKMADVYSDGSIHMRDGAALAVNLTKQRSVYFGKYRLTVYPTYSGFKGFVCDYEADRLCENNLLNSIGGLKTKLIEIWKQQFASDIQNGLAPDWPEETFFKHKSKIGEAFRSVQLSFTNPSRKNLSHLAGFLEDRNLVVFAATNLVDLCSFGFPEANTFGFVNVDYLDVDQSSGFKISTNKAKSECIKAFKFETLNHVLYRDLDILKNLDKEQSLEEAAYTQKILTQYDFELQRQNFDMQMILKEPDDKSRKLIASKILKQESISPRVRKYICEKLKLSAACSY